MSLIKIPRNVIEALELAHENLCDIIIISDSNKLAIELVLLNNGILGLFKGIHTNRISHDASGKLRIVPYFPNRGSHGCSTELTEIGKTCSSNMCKGHILRTLIDQNGYERVIYVGDGKNDYCPVLQLTDSDIACVRKDRNLHKLIQRNPDHLNPELCFWRTPSDLLQQFREIFLS